MIIVLMPHRYEEELISAREKTNFSKIASCLQAFFVKTRNPANYFDLNKGVIRKKIHTTAKN